MPKSVETRAQRHIKIKRLGNLDINRQCLSGQLISKSPFLIQLLGSSHFRPILQKNRADLVLTMTCSLVGANVLFTFCEIMEQINKLFLFLHTIT